MDHLSTAITKICFLHVSPSLIEAIQPRLKNKYTILYTQETNELLQLIKANKQQLVVVLGTNTENPVHLAITIHSLSYLCPIFIVQQPDHIEEITRELIFNPYANTQINLLSTDDWSSLPKLINASIILAKELRAKALELQETKINLNHSQQQTIKPSLIWQQITNVPCGIIVCKANGHIYYINDKAINLLTSANAKQKHYSILDYFHKDEYIKLAYLMVKTSQQKILETPLVFSTTSKLEFVEITAAINTVQQEDFLILFVNDISQKINMELQLISQNCEIQSIINYIPSIILCVDVNRQIRHLNSKAKALLQQHHSNAIKGRQLEEILPFMQQYSTIISDCLQKKTQEIIEGANSVIFGKNQFIDIHFSPYFYNNTAGVIIKFDNITHRLTKIEDKIKMEKTISLGHLSIGIAHSINNPLSGISIAVTNINNRLFKKDKSHMELAKSCGCNLEQIECYMNKQNIVNMHKDIIEQIHRISAIIKNILFFGSTSIQRPMDYYDIGVIIKNSIYMAKLERDLNQKLLFDNINIVEEYNNKLPRFRCNHTELSLALLHLLKNAAESIGEAENPPQQNIIHIRTYVDNQICYIEIEDNGVGIQTNEPEQLFEPFFSTDCKLAGLGLAICHSIIVHHHQGKIYPKKNVRKGAIFIVELPITAHHEIE